MGRYRDCCNVALLCRAYVFDFSTFDSLSTGQVRRLHLVNVFTSVTLTIITSTWVLNNRRNYNGSNQSLGTMTKRKLREASFEASENIRPSCPICISVYLCHYQSLLIL